MFANSSERARDIKDFWDRCGVHVVGKVVLEGMLDTAPERHQSHVIGAAMAGNEDDDRLIAFFEDQMEHWEVVADLAEPPMGFAAGHAAEIIERLKARSRRVGNHPDTRSPARQI
jgi:hypothetical protein